MSADLIRRFAFKNRTCSDFDTFHAVRFLGWRSEFAKSFVTKAVINKRPAHKAKVIQFLCGETAKPYRVCSLRFDSIVTTVEKTTVLKILGIRSSFQRYREKT